MTRDFFLQISTSAQIGSALLLIAVALWIIAFKLLEGKRGPSKSSR